MINTDEILASVGISGGAYAIYKVARILYLKYYVNSECRHPTEHSTDVIFHITDIPLEVPPLPSGLSSALPLSNPVNPLPH